MSVPSAHQRLESARKELARCREKSANEEKKAVNLDKEADSKLRSAATTRSPTQHANYTKQAGKKREDATSARGRAAGHDSDAAKAQKKVHDAEANLRTEEQREATKAADKRAKDAKTAAERRDRDDRTRENAHRREVGGLRARIDQQEQLLATQPWDQTPETITVLFIASEPEDQQGLRIDKEFREIEHKVRGADHRDALTFKLALAAQPADLLQKLNEVKPDIVHFSGHSGRAGLTLEDSDGMTRTLSTDELATLLKVSSRRIRLAVFNSCESATHAEAAVDHLEASIGMQESIHDDNARVFAGQLYSSIAFGLPLGKAFEQALLQQRLALGTTSGEPKLYAADGIDPKQLVLVQPRTPPLP